MKAASFTARRLQVALIGIPMLLGLLYFGLIAAPRYTAETTVAVRSAVLTGVAGAPGAVSLGTGTNLAAFADTLYLLDYVHSGALILELDKKLQLRKHYEEAQSIDPFYRLWPFFSQEQFIKYFRSRVEVEFDELTGLLTIRPQAFTAPMALSLSQTILQSCERFVNDFSQRTAREQMAFAEQELTVAAGKMQRAKEKLVEFQNANRIVDPQAQQAAASSLTAQLLANIATLEADLKAKLAYMQPDAPAVKAVREQVAGLRAQLETERLRTTSATGGDRLGTLNAQYQELLLLSQFAQTSYASANNAYEAARLEAAQKLKSLIIVAPPFLAQTAEFPRRIYNLITLFVVCVMVYTIARLILAAVREHQD